MARFHLFEFEDLDWFPNFLRNYSLKEMQEMIDELKNNGSYHWEMGRVNYGPGIVLYLVGNGMKKTKE